MARKADKTNQDEAPAARESKRKDDLHKRAVKRYAELEEYWADNRKFAEQDIKFRAGEHWPEEIKRKREKKGRPCLTFDKQNQYIRQVVNDGRQNRPSIKYRPVDDKADPKVAKGFQGITRHILSASSADEAFDTALDHAAGHGFGYFRVLTEYTDEKSFLQDITIKRVRNSMSVLLGPHQCADGSDAEDGFVIDDVPREVFERKWPKAQKKDWQTHAKDYAEGWLSKLTVRVCEYWYKTEEQGLLHLLDDNTTATAEDYAKDARPTKPNIVRSRQVPVVKVKWCRMSGAEILEERDWLGQFIPIVPVYGTETDIGGKVIYSGMIRASKDPALLYDYSRTAFAERVALSPKAPYVAAIGQVEEHPEWQTANSENHAVLPYTPQEISGTMLPPPRREQASDVPTGFAQDAQMAEHDIQSSIGMYNASVGNESNEKSGRAILARQREGDVGTFHYHDNLGRAVRYLGRILVDLIPKVYDTKRVIRMIGDDDSESMAMVNPDMPTGSAKLPLENGETVDVFNLNAGRYDVAITTGPSYTTKRQESAETMLELAQGNPAYWQTHGDLIVKSQDWPDADEFAKRTKALMPPEVKAAIAQAEEEDEDEGGPSPAVRAVMEQAQQAVQERDQAIQKLQDMLVQAKSHMEKMQEDLQTAEQRAMEAAAIKARELDIKEREVAIKETEAEARLIGSVEQVEQDAQSAGEEAAETEVENQERVQIVAALETIVEASTSLAMMVEQMRSDDDAPPEITYGPDGLIAEIRKGSKVMPVIRNGPAAVA